MNKPNETRVPDARPPVNEQRRRLTKGGLAAPVVLGTLLSRPVLGAAPHNCTISGQLSGNVSTHLQGICAELGSSPETWLATWPWGQNSDFYNPSRNNLAGARNFTATPNSLGTRFANAYRSRDVDGDDTNDSRVPTVLEVLLGYVPNYDTSFGYSGINPDFELRVRSGFSDSGFELGKEAIAAYLNAITFAPDFPLTGPQVVAMFNAVVVTGGTYPVSPTVNWDASQVLAYFQSLHT
ncbi:MAG: hypothetical protein V2I51_19840 [Anderseniella sp.]|nr:hypothetical protein [Anderseniella sp.]